jgi:uncharacterized membrane protein (UPF0127 family)
MTVFLLFAAAAQAFQSPLAYERTELRVNLQHPANPKDLPLRFDTEIRSSESAANSPGWYNYATMGDRKAAMVVYPEPATLTIDHGNDFAPSDILFIDAYGVIEQILPSIVTADLQEPVVSTAPMKAILYLQAGNCAKLGIAPGDQISYSAFIKRPVIITTQPAASSSSSSSGGGSSSSSGGSSSGSSSSGGAPAPANDELINKILRQNGGR